MRRRPLGARHCLLLVFYAGVAGTPGLAFGQPSGGPQTFAASGNEPAWHLTIADGRMTLSADYGATEIALPEPAPASVPGGRAYAGESAGHAVRVTVLDRICHDTMTGMPRPFSVEVAFDGRRLDGCGGEPATLLRGDWVAEGIDGAVAIAEPQPTMHFGDDGRVSGNASCNSYSGAYALTGEGLSIAGLLSTRKACPPPLQGQEDAFLAVLREVLRFERPPDGSLVLHGAGGQSIRAAADAPASPDDGGPQNWEVAGVSGSVNMREEPAATAKVLASYPPGTILDNLGCRRAGGRVWCDVQPLGGGPRGYVAAEFLKLAMSPDGRVKMGPDDSALRAGEGRFDSTGKIPCAQSAGQPMGQCEFGVARAGGGYATVVIKKPDGRTRAIFFRMGRPMGADTSQADGYAEFRATKESDLNLIRIGNERYEIPDAVVLGG